MRSIGWSCAWAVLFALLGFASLMNAVASEPMPRQSSGIHFPLVDLAGETHQLAQNDDQRVRVFVFLSTECPVANSYLETLGRLHRGLPSGALLYGVVSDATVTRAEAASHFAEYEVEFPILFDPSELLVGVLGPTHVPEAFVLNTSDAVVYRGAIDDTWAGVGRRRAVASRHYLADAVEAAVKGEPVAVSYSEPVGCLFESFAAQAHGPRITYTRDIAPIINTRCLNCHREGQAAPFALGSYEQVAKRADWIVSVTQDRIMPPWIPNPGHERFVGERWLTDRELVLLEQWADSGRARGHETDQPPTPEFAEGWLLGEPDMVLKMPEPFTVYANGPDLFQNFVIPVDVPSDKMVAAIEFHPGNKRVVHHSVLFLDSNGVARQIDQATPEPGYSNFGGPGFVPTGALGGWSVGNTPRRLPNGMGRYLQKGSDLVMQIHYHPTGKEEVDQSEVGLFFIDQPVWQTLSEPAKLVGSIWMANYEMDIPPSEREYRRTTSYTLPKEVIMVGVVPHMHLLGKSMKVTATLPASDDGSSDSSESAEGHASHKKTLIDIRDWNYNWQDEYYYERPFSLPAGTVLMVDAVFDNSASNPSNPNSPPKRVTWGEETGDEMLFCFFLLTAEKTENLIHVIQDSVRHDLTQPRAKTE